jgi:putative transposase
MRVHSTYRTVILQAFPTPKQEKALRKAEESVFRFLELSRRELQKLLYHKFKDDGIEPRMLSLLTQRFTGSLGEKAILCFDKDNSKFIRENGIWYVEVKLAKGRNARERIPIAKSDNEYYDVIEDLSTFPFVVARENDKLFVYVSIPVEQQLNGLVVGIDFNMGKWIASPYEGKPLFFDVRKYEESIDELQRKIGRAYQKKDYERANKLYQKITEIVKHAHGNFLKAIKERYGICTLAIEDISTMFKLTEKDSTMINNWLYKKTAMRKFVLRAMAKGFNVVEVNPAGTTKTCYRCGSEVKVYGKRQRLIRCDNCGLKDYNRDLNAARNIAKKTTKQRDEHAQGQVSVLW